MALFSAGPLSLDLPIFLLEATVTSLSSQRLINESSLPILLRDARSEELGWTFDQSANV